MENKVKNNSAKRFRLFDIIIIILLLLIAIISLDMFRHDLYFTFNLQNVESIGTVIVRKNTVHRRLGDRVLWDRLARESPVYVRDLIRVADSSAATLYIKGNSIDLEENTLVRIVPSPDGDGFMILMSYGNLSFFAESGAERITLNLNGQQFVPPQGEIFSATVSESGQTSLQRVDNINREIAGPSLISPAPNSLFPYQQSSPVLNFRWSEVEDAISYFVEVCDTPDFTNPRIERDTSATFFSDSTLEEGVWFWRVTPVFSPILGGNTVQSSTGFFRVVQTEPEPVTVTASLSQWLATQAPSTVVPQGIPMELIPALFVIEEDITPVPVPVPAAMPIPVPTPAPAPRPAPTPAPRPAPVTLLPAPANLRPVNGTIIGHEEMLSLSSIVFRWSAVQGANSYVFTFSQQTAAGRRQIIRTTLNTTSYTLNNLQLLDRGDFVWQVEAVSTGRGNVIDRRGIPAESTLIIDFQYPGPVYIEDTGILYGN